MYARPLFEAAEKTLQIYVAGCNVLGFKIVHLWNSLSEKVVSAESVRPNCFKNRFDCHCQHCVTVQTVRILSSEEISRQAI